MALRSLILALVLAVTAAAPALAGDKDKPKTVGQYVDLQPVAMPIVVNGQLVNYVFVYVRINLTGGADVIKLRTKEPFFRDALVREAYRTPFIVPGDWQKVDETKLVTALRRDADAIAGPGNVSTVVVTSQAPQHQAMPPRRANPTQP
jgi:hypothetical protein